MSCLKGYQSVHIYFYFYSYLTTQFILLTERFLSLRLITGQIQNFHRLHSAEVEKVKLCHVILQQ